MSVYWNFRDLLGVDPDLLGGQRNCVYILSNYKRCGNPVNVHDRASASRLLDRMDRCQEITGAVEDLRELAALLLCKHVHNNGKSRAYLSKVNLMEAEWRAKVHSQSLLHTKRKQQTKAAKEERAQSLLDIKRRQQTKAVKEEYLLDTKRSKQIKAVKEERAEVLSKNCVADNPISLLLEQHHPEMKQLVESALTIINQPSDGISLSRSPCQDDQDPALSDPFVDTAVSEGLSRKTDNLTPSVQLLNELRRSPSPPKFNLFTKDAKIEETKRLSRSGSSESLCSSASISKHASNESMRPDQATPSHVPQRPILAAVGRKNVTIKSKTIEEAKPPTSALEFGSQSTNPMHCFSFSSALETEGPVQTKTPFVITDNVFLEAADSRSSILFQSSSDTSPELYDFSLPPKSNIQISVSQLETPVVESTNPLEEPSKKETVGNELAATTAIEALSTTGIVAEIEKTTPIITKTTLKEKPSERINKDQDGSLQMPPSPLEVPNESFGYAEITPSSMRYSTHHLPTRRQYGLETPPETPEKPNKYSAVTVEMFRSDDNDFLTPSPPPVRSPFSVPRKPIPNRTNSPLQKTEEVIHKNQFELRDDCEADEAMTSGGWVVDNFYDDNYGRENEGKKGVFLRVRGATKNTFLQIRAFGKKLRP